MSEPMKDIQQANRTNLVPVIDRVKTLDLTGASFLVLDDEGEAWRVEFSKV